MTAFGRHVLERVIEGPPRLDARDFVLKGCGDRDAVQLAEAVVSALDIRLRRAGSASERDADAGHPTLCRTKASGPEQVGAATAVVGRLVLPPASAQPALLRGQLHRLPALYFSRPRVGIAASLCVSHPQLGTVIHTAQTS